MRAPGTRLALLGFLVGFAVALAFAWVSDDFYHEDDICHFLLVHDGWTDVDAALHVWGRPGYALPAMLAERIGGLRACRVLSVLMTALTALLAWGVAREVARGRPAAERTAGLAALLVWLQPLAFTLSSTTLTETPAALYLTLAVWLGLRHRTTAACAAASLLFVTRYEMLLFVPVVGVALLVRAWRLRGGARALVSAELWVPGLALAWAPLTYVAASLALGVSDEVAPWALLDRDYTGLYGTGTWHHFAERWLVAAGLGVLALAAAGGVGLGRRALLPAAAALGVLLLHTALFGLGLFASGGYERFLVPACGAVAALAAAGTGILGREGGRAPAAAALFVMGAAPLALLGHDASPLVRGVAVGVSAALGVAGLVVLRRPARPRAGIVAVAFVLAALEAVALVRPLVVLGTPPPAASIPLDEEASTAKWRFDAALLARPLAPRTLIEDALLGRALEVLSHAAPDAGLLTTRHFVRAHRLDAVHVEDAETAARLWQGAPPGTAFVWGGVRRDGRVLPFAAADAGLPPEGEALWHGSAGAFAAAVWIR